MDDSRAKHEQNLAVLDTGFFHPASNFVDGEYFGLFGRNCTLHESKRFAITCPLKWMHANTVMPDNYLITHTHFMHWPGVSATMGTVDDDCYIHLDIFNIHPLAVPTYLCGE